MRDDHPGEIDWLADAMPEPLKLIQPSERPWGRSARRAVQGKRKKVNGMTNQRTDGK